PLSPQSEKVNDVPYSSTKLPSGDAASAVAAASAAGAVSASWAKLGTARAADSRPRLKAYFHDCMGFSMYNNARPTQSFLLVDGIRNAPFLRRLPCINAYWRRKVAAISICVDWVN